jgi:hypothetical protein
LTIRECERHPVLILCRFCKWFIRINLLFSPIATGRKCL